MSLPNENKIKQTHETGIKGLFRVYNKKKLLKSLWIPSSISMVVFLFIVFNNQNILEIINSVISTVMTIMPSLLGFVLGGYAIIIGFGNEKFMKSTAKISEDEPISYYQTFSSVFAFSILCISFSLVISFVFYLIGLIDPIFYASDYLIDVINYIGLFILIFAVTYAIFQIPVMIINIFSFSQTHHINLVMQNELERLEKERHKKEQNN